jgi:TolA-binding protein
MITVPDGQMGHWGNYAAEWFQQGVEFLDSGISKPGVVATTQPAEGAAPAGDSATRPAAAPDDPAAQAAKALSLARNYIVLRRYDTARAKLQKIISAYPNTPAAREAQTLLNQIKDQS